MRSSGVTRARITCEKTKEKYLNDASAVVLKPRRGFFHSIQALTSIYDDFALFIAPDFFERTARREGTSPNDWRTFCQCRSGLAGGSRLARSSSLEQLFLAKILNAPRSCESIDWLLKEVLREILILGGGSGLDKSGTSGVSRIKASSRKRDFTYRI